MQFSKQKQSLLFKQTVATYIIFTVFIIIKTIFKLFIPLYILILIVITLFGHSFIGNYLNFYNRSQHFDRYLHVFGSFSTALFIFSIITNIINPTVSSKLYSAFFVVSLGMSSGVFFEIMEFSQDSISKTNHQKGLKDTDLDLICNVIGSTIAGVFAYFFLI